MLSFPWPLGSFRAAFPLAGIAGRVASMAKSDTLGVLFARCPSRGTQSGAERRDPGFSLLGLGRGLLCARGTLVRLSLEQKKRFYYPRLSAVKSSATLAAYPGQTALWVTSRR